MVSRGKLFFGKEFEDIKTKNIAIMGLGGTGSTVSQLIARMHPNKLIFIDGDIVEEDNLERQIIFSNSDLNKNKALIAKQKLSEFCKIEARPEFLSKTNISFENIDLIIDCTDSVETRLVINDYCKKNKLPWVHTGVIGNIGLVYFNEPGEPCFCCFNKEKKGERNIDVGVLNYAVSMVASLAVSLAMDYLINKKVNNNLIRFNLDDYSITKLKINSKDCNACNGKYNYL